MKKLAAAMMVTAMLLGACGGSDDPDPVETLEEWREAFNAGDIDAVMALFGEGARIINHPLEAEQGIATPDDIRQVFEITMTFSAEEDAYEHTDVTVVEGDPLSVMYAGTFTNERGECFGGGPADAVMTVDESELIVFWDWGGEFAAEGEESTC